MKLIVYTAVIGPNTDKLRDPTTVNPGVEYLCYTDQPIKSNIWRIIPIEKDVPDDCRFSRKVKILCQKYAAGAEVSLWLDAAFQLEVDPVSIANQYLWPVDMIALRHPHRDNIVAEAKQVCEFGLAPADQVQAQVARYQQTGFVAQQRTLTSTGLCMRRHCERVFEFSRMWWSELEQGCCRDQISIDYCIWRTKLEVKYIEGHYRDNPYARFWWSGPNRTGCGVWPSTCGAQG